MKKNNDIEEIIKDKMNRLSDSVDCFDRISARAFPEKNQDFYESGFTVSDLENVTDKARRINFVKWISVAVAAVVCIAVIPRTNLVQNIFCNIGSSKNSFTKILEEIDYQTENNDYLISDYPLDYYIKNDVLITPLFSCPFEKNNKENANVRIYTRQINGINTNQTYAVQYIGEYSENSITAVAESQYKFSDYDAEQVQNMTIDFSDTVYSDYSASAVQYNFTIDGSGISNNNENVSLASFTYNLLFKDENDIIPVTSEILYGHKTESDDYFYDIILTSSTEHEKMTFNDNMAMWKKSVYFNGNPANPTENNSNFTRTELFTEYVDYINATCPYVSPFVEYNAEQGETVYINADNVGKRISTIILPCEQSALPTTKLYFSPVSFDYSIAVMSEKNGLIKLYSLKEDTKEDTEEYYTEQAEREYQEILKKQQELEAEWTQQQVIIN